MTSPGFDAVERAFAADLQDPSVLGAALTLGHEGQVVLDRWGGAFDAARTRPW